jgi:hypothetical protein
VRVILDGQAEVAGGRLVRGFDDILTRTEQFNDGQRQIGKAERVGGFLLDQEHFERLRIRLRRKLEIGWAAISTIRSQRLGERTMRLREGAFFACKNARSRRWPLS